MTNLLVLFLGLTPLLPLTILAQGTIKVTAIDKSKLPAGIKFPGKLKQAIRWNDLAGDNIVVTSETGIYTNPKFKHENEGRDAELFAFHFIVSDSIQQTWKVYDLISDCPVDLEASFVKNTLQVTDLNNDGIGEVWVMYRTVCHGDVSPSDMKIIMYQGKQKYAMRGTNKVQVGEKEFEGGEYKFDAAFTAGPAEFMQFAVKLWNKNIQQKFE
ncbi:MULTISPECIES: M949_RS01915 family surface polysaccharide biosynthesis protein [Niastella]|uniref:Uncharacterized protein n=1 Tax=Niastella soli TaxID=2821487 RepID=A0ABS3Z512_9BACT|nr:hypothetical protein [Niastella soli]MBO9205239.1 hypothetical protein [Niastella soli]